MAGLYRIKTKIGDNVVEFETNDEKEMFAFSETYCFLPPICTDCGKGKVALSTNTDKDGNTYLKLRCMDCGADQSFGRHKIGGTLFWKRGEKMKRYSGKSEGDKSLDNVPF